MKKLLVSLLSLIMCLSIVGCNSYSQPRQVDAPQLTAAEDPASDESVSDDEHSVQVESTESVVQETEPEQNTSYEITYQNYVLYEGYSGDVRDYVLVQIQNTGTTDLYLGGATFDFEDDNGHLVGTDSGIISCDPQIIAPGEYGYFYSNMGSVSGGDIDVNAEYVLVPTLKVEESKRDIIRYEIADTTISEGKFGQVNVIGRITNNTDDDASMVWIAFVFFDENDVPLGVCGTNVLDLTAGSTQSFDSDSMYLSELDFSLGDVARYEVYACKTQYQF